MNADVRMDTGDNELNRGIGRRYDSGIDDSVRW